MVSTMFPGRPVQHDLIKLLQPNWESTDCHSYNRAYNIIFTMFWQPTYNIVATLLQHEIVNWERQQTSAVGQTSSGPRVPGKTSPGPRTSTVQQVRHQQHPGSLLRHPGSQGQYCRSDRVEKLFQGLKIIFRGLEIIFGGLKIIFMATI